MKITNIEYLFNGEAVERFSPGKASISIEELYSLISIPDGWQKDEYRINISNSPGLGLHDSETSVGNLSAIISYDENGEQLSTVREIEMYATVSKVTPSLFFEVMNTHTEIFLSKITELIREFNNIGGATYSRALDIRYTKSPLVQMFIAKVKANEDSISIEDAFSLLQYTKANVLNSTKKVYENVPDNLSYPGSANEGMHELSLEYGITHDLPSDSNVTPFVFEHMINILAQNNSRSLAIRYNVIDFFMDKFSVLKFRVMPPFFMINTYSKDFSNADIYNFSKELDKYSLNELYGLSHDSKIIMGLYESLKNSGFSIEEYMPAPGENVGGGGTLWHYSTLTLAGNLSRYYIGYESTINRINYCLDTIRYIKGDVT